MYLIYRLIENRSENRKFAPVCKLISKFLILAPFFFTKKDCTGDVLSERKCKGLTRFVGQFSRSKEHIIYGKIQKKRIRMRHYEIFLYLCRCLRVICH